MQHSPMAHNHNLEQYRDRIQTVMDFVTAHLDEKLSLGQLSAVANFSPFHFHRQFSAFTGLPLGRMVLLIRLKIAARSLGTNSQIRVMDIAQQTGFESPEAFSRAFHKFYGVSPSQFKKTPNWERFHENKKLVQPFNLHTQPTLEPQTMDVEIVTFAKTPIAALEHRGPERLVYETTRKFIGWRQRLGVSPQSGDTFGLHYSEAEPEQYRFDISVSYKGDIAPNPEGVVAKIIPEGRCAKLRHFGSREYIAGADFLYREWLPASGEELRDFPFFFHYVNVGPDVRDSDMVTDLYLPLQ